VLAVAKIKKGKFHGETMVKPMLQADYQSFMANNTGAGNEEAFPSLNYLKLNEEEAEAEAAAAAAVAATPTPIQAPTAASNVVLPPSLPITAIESSINKINLSPTTKAKKAKAKDKLKDKERSKTAKTRSGETSDQPTKKKQKKERKERKDKEKEKKERKAARKVKAGKGAEEPPSPVSKKSSKKEKKKQKKDTNGIASSVGRKEKGGGKTARKELPVLLREPSLDMGYSS
jgi:hypothetical protein